MSKSSHPYYPVDLVLEGFEPAKLHFGVILGTFALVATLLLFSVWTVSGQAVRLSTAERLWLCWFAFTGVTHLVVEGAYVLDSKFYQDRTGSFLQEIWKEYAKADSRYASRETFTVSMEFVTAFLEGPSCFLILYGIFQQASWRYVLQLMVSLGQLYGDILYFATAFLQGCIHSRPEALYFWVYFVAVNSIWVAVPLLNIVSSWRHISASVAIADRRRSQKVA